MMTPLRTALLLSLLGCTMPARLAREEVLPKPADTWQTAALEGAVQDAWWRSLGDDGMAKAVDTALTQNHDLRAAATRLQAAAIQARMAGAELYPSLDLSYGGGRQKLNFVGFSFAGSGGNVLTNTFNNHGVSLNSSWELDLWGRVRAGRSAAVADLEATAQELRAVMQSLAGQVGKAWFACVEARAQLELARATVQSFLRTEEQVRDRFAAGVRPSLDLRLARSNRLSAEAQLQLWHEQLDRARRQLEILLGGYPAGKLEPGNSLPPVLGKVPTGLPAELLQRRPDLAAAERRLVAAGYRVEQAHAALFPRISLTGSAGTSTQELEDLVDSKFFVWSLLGNLTQPIFQGGRLRAEVELAAVREREALETLAGSALRAYGEVESALAAEEFLAKREASLAAAAQEAVAARQLSQDRYRLGLDIFITVLSAQRSALALENQLLAIRRIRLDLRIDLHLALGGGFESTPAIESGER